MMRTIALVVLLLMAGCLDASNPAPSQPADTVRVDVPEHAPFVELGTVLPVREARPVNLTFEPVPASPCSAAGEVVQASAWDQQLVAQRLAIVFGFDMLNATRHNATGLDVSEEHPGMVWRHASNSIRVTDEGASWRVWTMVEWSMQGMETWLGETLEAVGVPRGAALELVITEESAESRTGMRVDALLPDATRIAVLENSYPAGNQVMVGHMLRPFDVGQLAALALEEAARIADCLGPEDNDGPEHAELNVQRGRLVQRIDVPWQWGPCDFGATEIFLDAHTGHYVGHQPVDGAC